MKKLFFILPIVGMLGACSSHTYPEKDAVALGYSKDDSKLADNNATDENHQTVMTIVQPMMGMVPKATAFKMNGDFADNVAITLGSDGQLTYFPAPSDISVYSMPTSLGNGWFLNNQGISGNSVFTKYTFEEYSKLHEVPSIQQLRDAIIPGAKVTDMIQLPYTIDEVKDNLQVAKDYIKNL